MADLQKALEKAGFSSSEAQALVEHFAPQGHVHGPDSVMVDDAQDLDSWGDSVEERLDALLEEEEEDEEG